MGHFYLIITIQKFILRLGALYKSSFNYILQVLQAFPIIFLPTNENAVKIGMVLATKGK